jgi:hypothetical protein
MNAARIFVAVGLSLFATIGWADDDTPHWVEHNFARQHAALMHKVRTLIIPKIDWNNLTAPEALKDLSDKCRQADPEHRGISFIGEPSLAHAPFRLVVHDDKKTLLEVLKSMPYRFTIGRSEVFFYYDAGEGISRAEFYVPLNYFKTASESATKETPAAYNVAPQLAAKGVGLPAGASATYLPNREKLIVVGGWEIVEAVDELLNP